MGPTASKEIMLSTLAAAEIDLLTTIALVPHDERMSRPICGYWTLHDLVGHLADWDDLFIYWLGLLSGNAPQSKHWDEDGDAYNEWLRQQRQGQSWEKNWADFRSKRAELHNCLCTVPPDEFMRVLLPHAGVSYPTIYHCAWSALEHFIDHATGVRRALAMQFPQELLVFHGPYT
jgi:hypothetical protein